jgi:hypothetical protein
VPAATSKNDAAVVTTVSQPRISTYLGATGGDLAKAIALYGWNARISAALMLPAHFAEVAARNAVDEALTNVYGPQWPWEQTFELSLPKPRGRTYNPRDDLLKVRAQQPTTGKVIAELKFVFWQNMFTARHDVRLWDSQIRGLFPGSHDPARVTRQRIYDDLEAIRKVRNRMAHHEPIFARNLGNDLTRMLELVDLRSPDTGNWVRAMEDATSTLSERP